MVGMASSASLTLFMSYPIDRAKNGEIKNVPQSVYRRACCGKSASTALCLRFAANHENEFCFLGDRMNTLPTSRTICTIISGTILNFPSLAMTLSH